MPDYDLLAAQLVKAAQLVGLIQFLEFLPELIRRISGRRVCPKCGASYHVDTMKPKVDGICDRCGAELIQRKDDNAASFKTRLDNYYKQTQPLIDFYKGKDLYVSFDGTKPLEELSQAISAKLEELK